MLGITNKTIYAVAALQELGKIEQDMVLKIKDIATLANVPQNFLEQILLELKKQGILMSTKGAYGGYKLAKKMKDITLKEVVIILESDIFSHDCKTQDRGLELFWKTLRDDIIKTFDVPLSQLQDYQLQATQTLNYSI